MHRPRTCSVIQHARVCVINNKSLRGFATSLSFLIAGHSNFCGVFLSLFTSLRCQPNVHGRSTPASSGWDHISSYPQNPINVVTRPLPQVSRSCEMINVAWARFQAEDIDSYQTRPAVGSWLFNAQTVSSTTLIRLSS
jgi:hypothetical protein